MSVHDPDPVERLVLAATPAEPRPLAGLLERLDAAGLVRGARLDDRPAGTGALGGIAVRGVADDSREITEGTLFVAVPGFEGGSH